MKHPLFLFMAYLIIIVIFINFCSPFEFIRS